MIEIILVCLGIIICGGLIGIFATKSSFVRVKKGQVFNFKGVMEISGLPIITLYQNNEKYNFLIDTGSNVSHIHNSSNIKIDATSDEIDIVSNFMGDVECGVCKVTLYNGKYKLPFNFRYSDMSFVVQGFKESYGVNIVGIIGTDFMNKYNYCIDFKEYVVYERK